MLPSMDREFNSRMRSHLRSGITPAQFELDILRYENLRQVRPSGGIVKMEPSLTAVLAGVRACAMRLRSLLRARRENVSARPALSAPDMS